MEKLKVGDIVTLQVDKNLATNTYIISHKFEGYSILTHPLNPDISLIKQDLDLNNIQVVGTKSPTENCLWYCKRNEIHLDYDKKCELKALSIHFIIYRSLSNSQKKNLSNICGYLAGINAENDLDIMIKLINDNKGLLDSFNRLWYENYRDIFSGSKAIRTKSNKNTIANMAGFVLAQIQA